VKEVCGEGSSPLSTKADSVKNPTRLERDFPRYRVGKINIICGNGQTTMDEVDRIDEKGVAIKLTYF